MAIDPVFLICIPSYYFSYIYTYFFLFISCIYFYLALYYFLYPFFFLTNLKIYAPLLHVQPIFKCDLAHSATNMAPPAWSCIGLTSLQLVFNVVTA